MPTINFASPADFYPARRFGRKSPINYRRFDTVAEAVRYAVEVAPPSELTGTLIECDEHRYEGEAISVLYRLENYPLVRAGAAA